MAVKNLTLSAQQVGDALGVCETAASRKIAEAEDFLCAAVLPAAHRLCKSRRLDRVRTAVVERLRTVAALAVKHPAELEPWIAKLVRDAYSLRRL